MDILQIVSGQQINGAVIHCLLLSRELAARGHRVAIACRPGAWVAGEVDRNRITVFETDMYPYSAQDMRPLAGFTREFSPDVLHTHMTRAHLAGLVLGRALRVPCLATAHSRHLQPFWALNSGVIAVSEATARYHRWVNFVPRRRIRVINNFIDYQRFNLPEAAKREEVRRALGLDPGVLSVGAVGSIFPKKGTMYLVRSFACVRELFPQARLLLVGGGDSDYIAAVRREIEQLDLAGVVVWTGPRTDIPDLLSAMDVFVSASLEENFSLALLEAMAAGVPVVATPVGGQGECIRSSEVGRLIPPKDARALAAAIAGLCANEGLRQRMGAAARQLVQANYSPEVIVPRIEAFYRDLRRN